MVPANNKGQLLVEVGVVMCLIAIVFFAAMTELSQGRKTYQKYQFTKEDAHAKEYSRPHKK